MQVTELVQRLGRNDVRLILRDRMLVMLLALVAVIGVVARYALPAIDASLAENGVMPSANVEIRFAATFPMFVAFIALWQGALMPGTVFGFLLLDEKEDDTLIAMRVSPVPIERYVGYRVTLPAVLAFCFTLVLVPLIGYRALPVWQLSAVALGAALVAPLATLLLATFADNKVQGLAYTKFAGVAGLTILVGWFVPEPWQWLLGLFPPFLVCKSYWMALDQQSLWWVPLLVGLAAEVGLVALLVRRFQRVSFP